MRLHLLLPILAFGVCGCDQNPPKEAAMAPEAWATQPKDQWPQIVLTHAATFKGHTPLNGASGFLVRADAGSILAATARHLLGENGGVEPEVTLAGLDASWESWVMYPRTRPEQRVQIVGSASVKVAPSNNDWLLLRVGGEFANITPLRIRKTPVKVGESVHLIGVSYAEPGVAQKVYSGTVTARSGDRFRYDISPHVEIPGFSGAPIVDDAGHLLGVMTVWFHPRMNGDLWEEAGGEDAASALEIMSGDK